MLDLDFNKQVYIYMIIIYNKQMIKTKKKAKKEKN